MEFGPFAVAIAFWAFVAIATVAGIIGEYKKRQLTLEPLRAAIEKGQQLDPAVVERLMTPPREDGINPIPLMVGGIVCASVGVGVALLAWFLSKIAPIAFYPVLGGGVVTLCIGAGLVLSARMVERARRRNATGG
ncbi:MAG: hypothetical protein JSS29_06770 [Proteobacteria bacterium]|nr:hypothetical protein [Pseudomonadota bacterium]